MKRALGMALAGIALALLGLISPATAQAEAVSPVAEAAPAACAWRTAQQVKLGAGGWVKLFVNGCGMAYMQAWWPPGKQFECSIYGETAHRYLEFTIWDRGCLSNKVNVGNDKVMAFAWVTDQPNGKYLGSAGTDFHRAR